MHQNGQLKDKSTRETASKSRGKSDLPHYCTYRSDISFPHGESAPSTMSDRFFFRCTLLANVRPRSLTRSLLAGSLAQRPKVFRARPKAKTFKATAERMEKEGGDSRAAAGGRRCERRRERRSEAGREDGNGTRIINSRTRGHLA